MIKGLQDSMEAFGKLDIDIGLEAILHNAVPKPCSDIPF